MSRAALRPLGRAGAGARAFSTLPFARSFQVPDEIDVEPLSVARDDVWGFTPLANVLVATGKDGSCNRMPTFKGREEKKYVITHEASIIDACKQMVEQNLSFLVVVRPTIAAGNTVIGVATERKYVTYGAQKIEAANNDERSDFLSGWSLSDPVYRIMTPTDRMLSVTQFDTVQHCVALLEKKLYRYLPIVSPDDGSLRGILTVRDLLRPEGRLWEPVGRLLADVSVEALLSSSAVSDSRPAGTAVETIQRYTIRSGRMISDAVLQMNMYGLNFLVVVDEGNSIVGIFTERDYVRYGSNVAERQPHGLNSTNQAVDAVMSPRTSMLSATFGQPATECMDRMLEANIRYSAGRASPFRSCQLAPLDVIA